VELVASILAGILFLVDLSGNQKTAEVERQHQVEVLKRGNQYQSPMLCTDKQGTMTCVWLVPQAETQDQ